MTVLPWREGKLVESKFQHTWKCCLRNCIESSLLRHARVAASFACTSQHVHHVKFNKTFSMYTKQQKVLKTSKTQSWHACLSATDDATNQDSEKQVRACAPIALSIADESFGNFDHNSRMCNNSVWKFQLVVEHQRDEKEAEKQLWRIKKLKALEGWVVKWTLIFLWVRDLNFDCFCENKFPNFPINKFCSFRFPNSPN